MFERTILTFFLATVVLAPRPTAAALAAEGGTSVTTSTLQQAVLPPGRAIESSIRLGSGTIQYKSAVQMVPVRDENGSMIAQVVTTVYLAANRKPSQRPVTFVFNGGPGAASVFLNFGALGPLRIQFGATGDTPSDRIVLRDNPGTWLDFTDLVFVDPVGTGYSHSFLGQEETQKKFWGNAQDVEYLARVIADWLISNNRLSSPKYLAGESHSGYRLPRITRLLQTRIGIGVKGLILISPILDSAQDFTGDLAPMPWVVHLPSMAAAHLETLGQLDATHMRPIIDYALGDYLVGLVKGRTDPAAMATMADKVSRLTGLNRTFVEESGARIDPQVYVRELHRRAGRLGSGMDSNLTFVDPFPYASTGGNDDPLIEAVVPPATSAIVDFYQRKLGWEVDADYQALSRDANNAWDEGQETQFESYTDLRKAVSLDPGLRVLIAHGWDDLSCPFLASEMLIDHLPAGEDPGQVRVVEYPGGHMFYSRQQSLMALHHDAAALYAAH
ncbi:peptidase S10 [Gluconacetobacter aggeris]|uniref:Peptidase S10 n=1 Tax=Gluconacetobacter aggeris TaxID=1286186 RepID=A0A7W4NZK7_9PROT|nr:peptidase S10 [Gluconacetobacter aggeris]MBB2169738.1 peptidase S10 [Gluconacetobacter aggeris]